MNILYFKYLPSHVYEYKCIGPNSGTQRVVNGNFFHITFWLDNMYQSVDLFPFLGLVYQKVLCMYNLCIYKYSRYNTHYMQLPYATFVYTMPRQIPIFPFPIRVCGSEFRPEIERGSVPKSQGGWGGPNLSAKATGRSNEQWKQNGPVVAVIAHRIHVWYIYLHLVDFYGKCR